MKTKIKFHLIILIIILLAIIIAGITLAVQRRSSKNPAKGSQTVTTECIDQGSESEEINTVLEEDTTKETGSTIGWYNEHGTWYYFNENREMVTGWKTINGGEFFFKDTGEMATGWQQIGENRYYFKTTGAMVTGWQQIDDNTFYLTDTGAMAVGWQVIDDKYYYFSAAGEMLTGWQRIDGAYYYFKPSGERASEEIVSGGLYVKDDGTFDPEKDGIVFEGLNIWYVKNGLLDKSYTGTVSSNGIAYNVVNGMISSPVEPFYFDTVFEPVAEDGYISFGYTGDLCEVVCVHACYCEVHSWTNPSTGHLGIDLICEEPGKELLAVASGTVVYVNHQRYENIETFGSYPGEAVAVYVGNGLIFEYHELQSQSVKVNVGDHVNAGDVIGKVGVTGVTTGYHIHFSTLYWIGAEKTDDLSEMPEYEGPLTEGFIQLNPLFFFGEPLAEQAEEWYAAHEDEWCGYKVSIPGDPRNYPKLATRIMED